MAVEPTMGQRKITPLFVEPQYEPMETVITPKSFGMIAALPQWPKIGFVISYSTGVDHRKISIIEVIFKIILKIIFISIGVTLWFSFFDTLVFVYWGILR